MKAINVRTKKVADLRELSAEELLDTWDPYDDEFSVEDVLLVYDKIKKYVVKLKLTGVEPEKMREVKEEELPELLRQGYQIHAVLKNGRSYLLSRWGIGALFLNH